MELPPAEAPLPRFMGYKLLHPRHMREIWSPTVRRHGFLPLPLLSHNEMVFVPQTHVVEPVQVNNNKWSVPMEPHPKA